MEDRPDRRPQRERAGSRDRMVYVDELGFDRAVLHAAAWLDLRELDLSELLLARFRFDQCDRERRRGNRRLRKLAHEVGNSADVVFVAVGNEQAAQLVSAFAHVREIVDNDVDAVHLVVGKHQAAIYDDEVVVCLDHGHVAPDLAATPKRNDPQVGFRGRLGQGQGV